MQKYDLENYVHNAFPIFVILVELILRCIIVYTVAKKNFRIQTNIFSLPLHHLLKLS